MQLLHKRCMSRDNNSADRSKYAVLDIMAWLRAVSGCHAGLHRTVPLNTASTASWQPSIEWADIL